MPTPAQFARRIRRIARNVEVNATDAQRAAAIAINQTVVLATPVDTGRARANWQVGIGNAPRQVLDDTDKEGNSTIGSNNGQIRTSTGRQDIYLSNNLDYIGRLNEGSSSQAPAGFVEQAVEEGVRAVRRSRLLRRR